MAIYLNAPPRPCLEPKPPNGEKKSVSVSKSKTFFSNKLSDISKNEANGLLEPKNWANVALGSPWNWYVKLLGPLPLVVPMKWNNTKKLFHNLWCFSFSRLETLNQNCQAFVINQIFKSDAFHIYIRFETIFQLCNWEKAILN